MQFTDSMTIPQTATEEKNQREKLPDILKGFAIILVVLGHCIQEGSGEAFSVRSLYFYDKLYQFIYSFHMPLFMAVSGYLCWGSMQRTASWPARITLLKKRACRLLVPVFLWTGADTVRILLTSSEMSDCGPAEFLLTFFRNAFYNLWFLWAAFWCFLIVWLMHFVFRDSVILYAAGYLIMFFIPDGLGLGAYKYMLPFFVAAFHAHGYLARHDCRRIREPHPLLLLLTGLCFALLFVFFDENSLIYLSGYKLIGGKNVLRQLFIDLYRTLIGFAGIIFFVLLWQYILIKREKKYSFRLLIILGRNSMGIYILSGYILLLAVRRIPFINAPSYLLNMAESGIILPLSLFLTVLAERLPFFCLFVGKCRKKSAPLP